MANTSQTSPGMQAASNTFVEVDGTIDTIKKNMNTEIRNCPWAGSAGPAFKTTMDQWDIEFAKIQFHMDEMAELLKGQSVQVLSTEDEAKLRAAGFFNQG